MKLRDWPSATLAEVCEINPRLPKEGRPPPDGIVSFVPMVAVNEVDGAITAAQIRAYAEVCKGFTPIRDGDVLFAKITPCMENGKVALATNLVGGVGFGSTEFHVLRASSRVLPEWLRYFVWQPSFRAQAKRRMTGAVGQQRVPAEFLAKVRLPVPPISEQRRLVDILSRAEGIVRLRREGEKKAAEVIPALFLDMFGDPVTNPKGWPEVGLADIAEVVSGITKGRNLAGRATVPVPYLRVANVQAGYLDLAEIKYIDVLPGEASRLALKNGDVVLTEGGDFDKLGRGALWELDVPNCVHQNHVFRVRLDRKYATPKFFVTYLQTSKAREYFLQRAKRTTNLASINMTQLRGLPVPRPPNAIQEDFSSRFDDVRSIQSQQEAATVKGKDTFNALLSRTFAAQANG